MSSISPLSQSPEMSVFCFPAESTAGKMVSSSPMIQSREILFYFPTKSIARKVCLPCFPVSIVGNVLLPLCQPPERSVFLMLPCVSRRKCLSCMSPVSVAGKVYLRILLSIAGKVCLRKLSYVIYFPLCQSLERSVFYFPTESTAGKVCLQCSSVSTAGNISPLCQLSEMFVFNSSCQSPAGSVLEKLCNLFPKVCNLFPLVSIAGKVCRSPPEFFTRERDFVVQPTRGSSLLLFTNALAVAVMDLFRNQSADPHWKLHRN